MKIAAKPRTGAVPGWVILLRALVQSRPLGLNNCRVRLARARRKTHARN